MSYWKDIEDAPIEQTVVLRLPGFGQILAKLLGGFEADEDETTFAWVCMESKEENCPSCWSDGVCWSENEEGKESLQPDAWRPIF